MSRARRSPRTASVQGRAGPSPAARTIAQASRWMLAAILAFLVAGCGVGDGSVSGEGGSGAAGSAAAETAARSGGPGGEAGPRAEHDPGAGAGATAGARAGDEAPERDFPALEDLQRIPRAYAYAAKYPELFARIPCYCPCALYGHPGLDGCYRSQHAAQCAACLEEGLLAGRLYEEAVARGEADMAAVAEQVKQRFRSAVVRQALQNVPMANTPRGRAYVQNCSQCHQLPHPGMYAAGEWKKTLSRMRSYARQQELGIDDGSWEDAVAYIREVSSRFPESAGERYREQLARAVEQLQAEEGDAVYYPGAQDSILETDGFERMIRAYRTAGSLPASTLASVNCDCGNCSGRDHETLLACLNSGHAISCERAVELVEEIAAGTGAAGP